jgi:hypothetical protein
VRSLGGNAPAIFGDNGHMTDQDWATRYDAIRQASWVDLLIASADRLSSPSEPPATTTARAGR